MRIPVTQARNNLLGGERSWRDMVSPAQRFLQPRSARAPRSLAGSKMPNSPRETRLTHNNFRGSRLLAEHRHDCAGAGMARIRGIARVGLDDYDVKIIPGDDGPGLRDLARHDHGHVGRDSGRRWRAVARVCGPVHATGGGSRTVLEALERGWSRTRAQRVVLRPLRAPEVHQLPDRSRDGANRLVSNDKGAARAEGEEQDAARGVSATAAHVTDVDFDGVGAKRRVRVPAAHGEPAAAGGNGSRRGGTAVTPVDGRCVVGHRAVRVSIGEAGHHRIGRDGVGAAQGLAGCRQGGIGDGRRARSGGAVADVVDVGDRRCDREGPLLSVGVRATHREGSTGRTGDGARGGNAAVAPVDRRRVFARRCLGVGICDGGDCAANGYSLSCRDRGSRGLDGRVCGGHPRLGSGGLLQCSSVINKGRRDGICPHSATVGVGERDLAVDVRRARDRAAGAHGAHVGPAVDAEGDGLPRLRAATLEDGRGHGVAAADWVSGRCRSQADVGLDSDAAAAEQDVWRARDCSPSVDVRRRVGLGHGRVCSQCQHCPVTREVVEEGMHRAAPVGQVGVVEPGRRPGRGDDGDAAGTGGAPRCELMRSVGAQSVHDWHRGSRWSSAIPGVRGAELATRVDVGAGRACHCTREGNAFSLEEIASPGAARARVVEGRVGADQNLVASTGHHHRLPDGGVGLSGGVGLVALAGRIADDERLIGGELACRHSVPLGVSRQGDGEAVGLSLLLLQALPAAIGSGARGYAASQDEHLGGGSMRVSDGA